MPVIPPFLEQNYPETEETQCMQIYIPAGHEYKWALAGLMRLLGYETNYQNPTSDEAIAAARVWKDAYVQTDWGDCVTPQQATAQSRAMLLHRWAIVTSGNALQVVVDPTQILNHYTRQFTAALGNETYQDIYLNSGHYEIRVLHLRVSGAGKVSWIFQNQDSLTQVVAINQADLSGATQPNTLISASFDLSEDGLWRMYTNVQAAGATGAGFIAPIICTEVWKTGEL